MNFDDPEENLRINEPEPSKVVYVDKPRPEEADQQTQFPETSQITDDIIHDINCEKNVYGIILTALIQAH